MLYRSRIIWIVLGLMVVGASVVARFAMNRPKGYHSLENLVMEMTTAIEERDEKRLARLCHDPPGVTIERMARQQARLDYLTMLHENRSWHRANSWALGGCGRRFNSINIEFVKQLDGKWYLKRIWGCR